MAGPGLERPVVTRFCRPFDRVGNRVDARTLRIHNEWKTTDCSAHASPPRLANIFTAYLFWSLDGSSPPRRRRVRCLARPTWRCCWCRRGASTVRIRRAISAATWAPALAVGDLHQRTMVVFQAGSIQFAHYYYEGRRRRMRSSGADRQRFLAKPGSSWATGAEGRALPDLYPASAKWRPRERVWENEVSASDPQIRCCFDGSAAQFLWCATKIRCRHARIVSLQLRDPALVPTPGASVVEKITASI